FQLRRIGAAWPIAPNTQVSPSGCTNVGHGHRGMGECVRWQREASNIAFSIRGRGAVGHLQLSKRLVQHDVHAFRACELRDCLRSWSRGRYITSKAKVLLQLDAV